MRPLTRLLAVSLVGLLACLEQPTTPSTGGVLNLRILGPGSSAALDSGYVRLIGPTDTVVKVTPGSTVTIGGLRPGSYTVVLEGFRGGGVAYFGQTSGVNVAVGPPTAATVTVASFQTAILDMPSYTVDGQFVIVYSKVPGASGYVVQKSADPGFATKQETTIAASDTSPQVSIPTTGPYYVRVLAIDPYNQLGQPSVARAITTVTTVTVTPPTATIAAGATQTFTAVAKDAGGNPVTGVTFFWASSNQNVALVDQVGVATGMAGGAATISALGLGLPGSAALTVSAAPAPVPTQVAFTVQPSNATAGSAISPAVEVEVRDASGSRVGTARDAVTLAIGTNPGSGTLSGTATVNAVNGIATFSGLSIDKAGTGYTLVASSGTLTSATSAGFDVAAPVVTQVAFTVQPTNATAGVALSPAIQVELRDASGNRVTIARDAVSLTIAGGPPGATLVGTTTVNAVNGVATFSGLSIDRAGTGYTLVATSGAVSGATSAAFDIIAAPPVSQLAFTVQPTTATAGSAIS